MITALKVRNRRLRKTSILVAACWNLFVTVLILPGHTHAPDFHSHTSVAVNEVLGNSDAGSKEPHSHDDCQFCKLESQLQLLASDSPVQFESPCIVLVCIDSDRTATSLIPLTSSGRAPPATSLTLIV